MESEPVMDLAHLGHLELLTPKPQESLRFFVDVLGMTESGREGDSVYLRAYDDYERHSLKLTASKLPGLGHVAYRTRSPQALERRVAVSKDRASISDGRMATSHTGQHFSARIPTGTGSSSTTKPSGMKLHRTCGLR